MATSGVIELTAVEIADETVGVVKSAGPDRLRGASRPVLSAFGSGC